MPTIKQSDSIRSSTEKTTTLVLSRKSRVGSGKGSPLKPRKVKVSKRQERVRAKRGFDLSEIGPATATPPRPKKTKPSEAEAATSFETTDTPDDTSEAESSQPASPRSVHEFLRECLVPDDAPTTGVTATFEPDSLGDEHKGEDRSPLRLQVREKCTQAGVRRFQLLISKLQDEGEDVDSRECELKLFGRDLEHWQRVHEPLETGLRLLWSEAVRVIEQSESVEEHLRWIVSAHNAANGVANSMAHLVGYIVQAIAEKLGEDTQTVIENLEDQLRAMEHAEYIDILDGCECEECSAVKAFDNNYKRYANHFPPFI